MDIRISSFIFYYCLVIAFILGSCIGSFILCQAYRIIHHENWWSGRSHCDSCGHTLTILDLFPIVSYIFLHGRCRYCHKKIGKTSLLVEVGLGSLFTVYLAYYGRLDLHLFGTYGLFAVLLGLSIVDMQSYEIPDGYILFGVICWLFTHLSTILSDIVGAVLIAGSILLLVFIMDKVMKKETMGGGDIKLYFLVTLFLGGYVGLLNVILSCIVGLLFVLIRREEKIPFGPSISISTVICVFIGNSIVQWYLGLLGM